MYNKGFEEIQFDDIQNLIQENVVENQNLEYKREVWGVSDSNKKEMLKDIASMANRYGGFLIIGIEEDGETGKAVGLVNVPDAESERDRILSTLFTSIQPRISLKIKVLTNNGISIIVINIPNSFKKPHIITCQGLNQFWVRHDRQKMLMSIDEIEESIINTVNLTKNVDLFLKGRKDEIKEEVNFEPTLLIGAYPVSAEREMVDISDNQLREYLKRPPQIRPQGANFIFTYASPRPSFYGLSIGDSDYRKIELHRNGYLEGRVNLTSTLVIPESQSSGQNPPRAEAPIIRNWSIVEYLFSFAKQVKQIYSYLGYDGQIFIMCSLLNIKDMGLEKYGPDAIGGLADLARWKKQNLEIPTLVFSEIDDVKITKTISDRIWQSFGFENEPFFNGRDFRV